MGDEPAVELAAVPPLVSDIHTRVDRWRDETFFNTSVSRDTELWNAVHASLETLKADISRLIKE